MPPVEARGASARVEAGAAWAHSGEVHWRFPRVASPSLAIHACCNHITGGDTCSTPPVWLFHHILLTRLLR